MTAPISLQQDFWNSWNAECREIEIQDSCRRQAEIILGWFESMGRRDLKILEVGCGAGWLCPQLAKYGKVMGTHLSDDVLARSRKRFPEVDYVAGDFMELDFGRGTFDVVVTVKVLSHVADQEAFVRKMNRISAPPGAL